MASFETNFEGFTTSVLDSFEKGLEDRFKVIQGIRDFSKVSYPSVFVFPTTSNYEGQGSYSDNYQVLFVFEEGSKGSDLKSQVSEAERGMDDVIQELDDNSDVVSWKVDSVEYLIAENSGQKLNVIEVTFAIQKLITYNE